MKLDFEPPNKFAPERYIEGLELVPPEVWENVPNVVCSTLAQVLGPDVPIDPQIAFRYFKNGRLPEFVVAYFMWIQKVRRNTAKSTIFCRALHYMEAFREYMINASGVMKEEDVEQLKAEQEESEPEREEILASDPAFAAQIASHSETEPDDPEETITADPAVALHGPATDAEDEDGPSAADEGFLQDTDEDM